MRRERFERMNVVPFIDIVLVLLVIVLATATFATNRALKVDLPKSGATAKENTKSVTLTIKKDGTCYFGQKETPIPRLRQIVATLDPTRTAISIHTDQNTPFRYFVAVMDLLKARGFAKIAVITTHY